MRSNSGKDEARNNMRDPTTLRNRDREGEETARAGRKPKAPADHRTGRKD